MTTMEQQLEINTLVTHKRLKSLGIGCISKVLKSSVKVNFGLMDTVTCKPSMLEIIDTDKCMTIDYNTYRNRILSRDGIKNCIVGNELREFVGIGWITLRAINKNDLKKYPRVI